MPFVSQHPRLCDESLMVVYLMVNGSHADFNPPPQLSPPMDPYCDGHHISGGQTPVEVQSNGLLP